MNWGHGITIVIIIFLAGMLGMVFYASKQNNEMYDDNYYQQEMTYQKVIDAKQNLFNISSNNMIQQGPDEIIIIFPSGTFEKIEQGSIDLLRTDSKSKDVHVEIRPSHMDRRFISKALLSKGIYKVRIKWTSNHQDFYREENLYVE